jgi:hypothetical protein
MMTPENYVTITAGESVGFLAEWEEIEYQSRHGNMHHEGREIVRA